MGSAKKLGVTNKNLSVSPIGLLIMTRSLIFIWQKCHGVGNFDWVLYLAVKSNPHLYLKSIYEISGLFQQNWHRWTPSAPHLGRWTGKFMTISYSKTHKRLELKIVMKHYLKWNCWQVAGTAVFVDDMPRLKDELCLVLVTSTRAKAKIRSICFEEALKVKGVVGHISANDYPRYLTLLLGGISRCRSEEQQISLSLR